jgi:hypothetical protein
VRRLLVLAAVALGLVVVPTASAWTVSMTADASFKRTYHWTIEKSVSQSSLTLAPGQTANVTYHVTVSSTGFTDSDWRVDGTVDITSDPDIQINSLGVFGGSPNLFPASVTCVPDPPSTLGAGMNCTYGTALPDASARTALMRASVTDLSTGVTGARVAQKPYSFAGVAPEEVDECVAVTDSMAGSLGTVCAGDAPKTFTYSRTIGPYAECGEFQVDNTARFTTNDTGATGSDGASVDVTVPCDPPAGGCTLTPGYWKTHSTYGPAPYDATWALVGEDTAFFLSGKSHHQALWTAPGGNAYYILAHAYIAAKLNFLNGSDPSAAETAYDAATALLNTYTPAQIRALRGSSSLRQQFVSLAATLDDYNNGLIGPGHCSENGTAASAPAIPAE